MLIGAGKILDKAKYFEGIGYQPHESQWEVHDDTHRHKVLCIGRRWGKTLLGALEVEPRAFVKNFLGEAQRGWIVGPNYDDCEKEYRIVYDHFKALGIEDVSDKFLNNVDNGNMHIHTSWGFDLECKSAMHPETLVGEGLDFVLMVEAGRQKRKTWTEYIRPTLSDKKGWSLHTGVPEGTSDTSLLYSLWQRGQSPQTSRGTVNPWKSWRMPSWTNIISFPGGRQDPEILDAEDDLTADEFSRQYEAKFVERVGRVMQEWDDELHISDLKYQRGLPLYMAIDYGYTNPFVILWIQVDAFNNVYVIRERRWTLKDTVTVAHEIKSDPLDGLLAKAMVAMYPDPAEPDDTETMKTALQKPARANTGGLLKTRLDLIRQHLKVQNQHLEEGHVDRKPKLMVDRKCRELAWEMREGYRWPEHKSEIKSESENPMDKNNHSVEALGRFFKGYMSVVGSGTEMTRHVRQSRATVTTRSTRMGTAQRAAAAVGVI